MVLLAGLRGKVSDVAEMLEAARGFCEGDASVQLLRGPMVFGRLHLESAADHAVRSFKQNRNTSNSLAVETLLYSSGTRQIERAIEKMGIREGDSEFAVVAFGDFRFEEFVDKVHLKRDDSVLDGDVSTLAEFGLSNGEVSSVPESRVFDLVLERVALVDVLR